MSAAAQVVIVGSGFAGTILARVLNAQGHRVVLIERGRHPRFALGESSTPLAALGLERLGRRYGLNDLFHLAAYGRWLEHMPQVRRGLKRGFTFYGHSPGERFQNSDHNERRLLVAASPHDAIADAHWLRADVDRFLVERACAEGVEYLDRTELTEACTDASGWTLRGHREETPVELRAPMVVDASGAGGFLPAQLRLPPRRAPAALDTGLLYGHFDGVGDFLSAARTTGARFPDGPYPDERAAVHHLLDEGWMYVLPFDHGVASAGIVYERLPAARRLETLPPQEAWNAVLSRYPTLEASFREARPQRAVARTCKLQHRSARAAGPSWALLPGTFCFLSPLFSTGIAWSVVAVERLGLIFESLLGAGGPPLAGPEDGLARYGRLLDAEADHLEHLIAGAYGARHDFDRFAAFSELYFAAASFAEASQRLLPPSRELGEWAWDGFLGATDAVLCDAVRRAPAELSAPTGTAREANLSAVSRLIGPRNLAGLADARRNRLYPVDLDALVAHADLLGLSREEVRAELPRLRGGGG